MIFAIDFREEDAYPLAQKGFVSMCGFKPGSEKHAAMLERGMGIREQGLWALNMKALISEHEPSVVHENSIEVNGVSLRCDAVCLLEKEKLRKVLFYIVTANECACGSDQILDRVYADFWGTAYVDAAHDLLKGELKSRYVESSVEKNLVLSPAFGPGYYGMPTEEVKTLFKIIDGSLIGVNCLESCVMVPVKSCAGMFFIMDKGAEMPGEACGSCAGNRSGCKYCNSAKSGK